MSNESLIKLVSIVLAENEFYRIPLCSASPFERNCIAMSNVTKLFIEHSRSYLTADYQSKIERCLDEITDEQAWSRPNEASNSVANLILHLCGNARQWIVSGVGQAEDIRVRQSEFDARGGMTRDELKEKLRRTLTEVDNALSGLTELQLSERRVIQGNDVTVFEAVYHVVEHFSMHTGQIIMLTKMLANKEMDFYSFPGGKAQANWK
jgi:uncharacterized damage-inducible protein DinB